MSCWEEVKDDEIPCQNLDTQKNMTHFLNNNTTRREAQSPSARGAVLDSMLVDGSAVLIQIVLTTERAVAFGLWAFKGAWGHVLGLYMAFKGPFGGKWARSLTSIVGAT